MEGESMITKITINNVASYKLPTSLETDKKTNLIYGLNGSGKTIVSNYMSDLNDQKFENCSVEGFNQELQKILVYNEEFVKENFYETGDQKGIFTLKKENKDVLESIENAKGEKRKLQGEMDSIQNSLSLKEREMDEVENRARDTIWKIKMQYTGGDRVFDNAGFLNRLKAKKEDLFNYIVDIPFEDIAKTIDKIKIELQEVEGDAIPRNEISPFQIDDFAKIEKNAIFQEEITGSHSSSVSSLIEKLGNSDWVMKGLGYIDEENNSCPFCQKDTLTADLKEKIRGYFDETYGKKVNQLNDLKQSYADLQNSVNLENYSKDFFKPQEKNEIGRLFRELQEGLAKNFSKIQTKVKNPSQIITLVSSEDLINQINEFALNRNNEIKSFNNKISNQEQTIRYLKTQFWQVLRKEYNSVISDFKKRKKQLDNEKRALESKIDEIDKKIKYQNTLVSKSQQETINIAQTIDDINVHLLHFGIKDFKITEHENNYLIKREYEQDDPVFKSLSEGEKTVISFLYFVELCKGKESPNDIKEKVIVIDDPISSLSHMYIFNVAQLIKENFITPRENEFLQCFILTHSLYFFHELVIRRLEDKKQNQKFFRITKQDTSEIEEMKHNAIQNDYEVYWHIVKTAHQNNMPLVANAMRNILEHFFGFIEKADNINNIFQKDSFKDNKFQSFKRYMDRESHTDRVNISDYKEFDLAIFMEAFEEVFCESGYKEHYQKFMARETSS